MNDLLCGFLFIILLAVLCGGVRVALARIRSKLAPGVKP